MRVDPWAAIREVATHRAADPITLEDLRTRPEQVGALVLDNVRVEPALYHRCNVVDGDGLLRLPDGVSPVTKGRVNGFQPAPDIFDLTAFVSFVDWDGDGWVSLSEVAVALAAVLPVDVEGTEQYLRDRFDVGQDGFVAENELRERILPFCGVGLRGILQAVPVTGAPLLGRDSVRRELHQWFEHWDVHGTGELDLTDFRFAVAQSLYRALGDAALETKETITGIFLAEAHPADGGDRVSREDFVDVLAPALLANLPILPARPPPPRRPASSMQLAFTQEEGAIAAASACAETCADVAVAEEAAAAAAAASRAAAAAGDETAAAAAASCAASLEEEVMRRKMLYEEPLGRRLRLMYSDGRECATVTPSALANAAEHAAPKVSTSVAAEAAVTALGDPQHAAMVALCADSSAAGASAPSSPCAPCSMGSPSSPENGSPKPSPISAALAAGQSAFAAGREASRTLKASLAAAAPPASGPLTAAHAAPSEAAAWVSWG